MYPDEFDECVQHLLDKGIIRICGHAPDGDPILEKVPYNEMTDEAKAYDAYLEVVGGERVPS